MRLAVVCLIALASPCGALAQGRYEASGIPAGPLPYAQTQPTAPSGPPAAAPASEPERGGPPSTSASGAGPIAEALSHPARVATTPATNSASATPPPSPYAPDAAPPEVSPPELMGAMLAAPQESRIAGRPISLAQVIAAGGSRDEQTVRINAYWDLCSSVADYYLGLVEAREVQILQERLQGIKAANAVGVAAVAVRDRVSASQTAAVAAQMRLASLMQMSHAPLPADPPHCGGYDTMYDRVFASRQSAEAMNLDRLIRLRYEELRAAAEGVKRAEAWIARVAKLQTANSTGAGILRALELLALNRRAFVQIAKDYNRQITRYVELARPGRIDDERLVRMHLGARSSATAASPSRTPRATQALPPHIGAGRR